ncbi:hypothetical protein [Mycolicibacterium palauense]|uniref:hypothetical protein n=1 Tax=Mycolicibacterium palauense TaxID=2034511 RepID=UPI000BFEC483|nr:hypothetical protein [Mycolicibacterium palauense]
MDSEHGDDGTAAVGTALKAHIRMRLAFWQAQDRRSITVDGPAWLWRGRYLAPLRLADLSTPTAELIVRRRASGMHPAALYGTPGPRRRRLPRWISPRGAVCWVAAAVMLAFVAALSLRAPDDDAGIGAWAAWGAAACGGAALVVASLLLWANRDPLKLTRSQAAEVHVAQRTLDWNPLAGAGPVSAGGAFLLEGFTIVSLLDQSPAWDLPGLTLVRTRFDADEEIFQIARAACVLDQHEINRVRVGHLVTGAWAAALRGETRHLTEALLGRLMVLHQCVATLDSLYQRAQRAGVVAEVADSTFWAAAAENELAAASLDELNTDLLAMFEFDYSEVGSTLRPA